MKKKLTILAAFLLALPVSAQTDGELEQMVEQTLRQDDAGGEGAAQLRTE